MTLLTTRMAFDKLASLDGIVVKTCGIMRVEHAVTAATHGASMVGLVFARSRRTVSAEFALAVRAALDTLRRRPLLVGVFVNEAPDTMFAIAEKVGLDVLQLSGDESQAEVAKCVARYPVLKAFRIAEGMTVGEALLDLQLYRELASPSRLRFLVDTYRPGEYGGTGMLSDWGIASALAQHEGVLLAGGLTPANVSQALEAVNPWGVDVSSGIERDGVKDPDLICSFIGKARHSSNHRDRFEAGT